MTSNNRLKVLILFWLCFIINSIVFSQGSDKTIKYVASHNGLNLRSNPNTDAKILKTLNFGDKLLVDSEYGYALSLGNMPGNWVKVNSEGVEGYIYSAYISTYNYEEYINQILDESTLICDLMIRFISEVNESSRVILNSNYIGEVFDYKVYEDYSNSYFYHGNESTVFVFESFNLNPLDVLLFLKYINYVKNRGQKKYEDSISFEISVKSGSDSYYIKSIKSPWGKLSYENFKCIFTMDVTDCKLRK